MSEATRRASAAALAVLLAVGLAACSDDDSDPGDGEGTEQGAGDGRDGEADDRPDDGQEGGDDQADGDDEDAVELLEPADLPAEAVPFAAALAATFVTEGAFTSASASEAECLSTNVVAIIGAQRFADAGLTPEAFGANPDLAATGIDRAEAEEIYDLFAGCGLDYAAATIESIALEAPDQAAARACLSEALDDATVRELAVAALLGTVDESPEAAEGLADIEACTAPDEG